MFVVETITEIPIEKALHARSSMRVPTNSSANRRLCFLTEQPTLCSSFSRVFQLPLSLFRLRFRSALSASSLSFFALPRRSLIFSSSCAFAFGFQHPLSAFRFSTSLSSSLALPSLQSRSPRLSAALSLPGDSSCFFFARS